MPPGGGPSVTKDFNPAESTAAGQSIGGHFKRKTKVVPFRYLNLFQLFAPIPKSKATCGESLILLNARNEQHQRLSYLHLITKPPSLKTGRVTSITSSLLRKPFNVRPRSALETRRLTQRIMLALKIRIQGQTKMTCRDVVTVTSKSSKSDCSMSSRFRSNALLASKRSIMESRLFQVIPSVSARGCASLASLPTRSVIGDGIGSTD